MAVPQVIDTNLDEQLADDLKSELDDYLQQEALHNPFIDIIRGSCYNQKAADLVAKAISKAKLSWQGLQHVIPIFNRFISISTVVWLRTKTSHN